MEMTKLSGHSALAYYGGPTNKYVGEVEANTYTSRAEQIFGSREAPILGILYMKRRLARSDIDTCCQ